MTRVVLVGGGLANSLIAWRLAERRPGVDITLLEQGEALGGNHTWSYHASDLAAQALAWMRPLVAASWDAQEVRFPAYSRRLDTPYHSVTSAHLHERLADRLGARLRTRAQVADVGPDGVRLTDGEAIPADLVLDGRGAPALGGFDLAWQKFVGVEIETARAHGMTLPLLMDATVEQLDGYRFVYVLPLGERRLLVEDTCYSANAALDTAAYRRRCLHYAEASGWSVVRVDREEQGCLPIVLAGNAEQYWQQAGAAVPRTGMRALLFHHTTGYSLPDAVRLADEIAAAPRLESAAVGAAIRARSLERWRRQWFARLLNRLMFEAAAPAERYRTLEHFYRLPAPLIERFYAGRLRGLDPLRLLSGRPPVPVGRAVATIARGALKGGTA